MRRRNNERVQYLENEWQREVERLKESHSNAMRKVSEDHEQDLSRLRRIKEQEIESVNALQNHGLSLEALLDKWEKSAQQIEQLHKSVITKQEEILKHKFSDIEVKNKHLEDVEVNWHSLITELEIERSRCSDETKKLYDIIEQQKQLLQSEQRQVMEDKLFLEENKKKQIQEKQSFDTECNRIRDALRKETEAVNEERIKLKEELNCLEAKKNEINLKEIESKQTLKKEKEEINRLFKEAEERRNELHREATQLQHQRMALQAEQHQLEQRKLMFDVEKHKMQDLAQEIAKRAEELETLSEIALHEKREGHLAMDEADKFKRELDSRLKFIEESFAKLRTEEDRVNKTKVRVEQELEYIKETKDNIVCNLCGSGLNRGLPSIRFNSNLSKVYSFSAKLNGITKNSLNDFNNISAFMGPNQWSGMQDTDRALLIWQITGQQDAALLEQETAFVNAIRSQTQTTGIAFQQQNDYFINDR